VINHFELRLNLINVSIWHVGTQRALANFHDLQRIEFPISYLIILAMAPAATNTQPPAKSKKEKEREKRERAAQQQTERLKVVIRRLPPNLPEDIFWQTVQQWVTEETTSWKVFYPGKFKKRYSRFTWATFVKLISNLQG
jgi:Smg-4/UPF3 family